MPERTVLECDVPTCALPGRLSVVEQNDRWTEVILCSGHEAPLRELMALGRPAKQPPRRRSVRGVDEERLGALFRDND